MLKLKNQNSSVTIEEICEVAGEKMLLYEPLPAPSLYHVSQARNRWLLGGNRSGKSEANIGWDLCAFALGLHPYRQTPSCAIIWVAAETWQLVGKLLWQEKISHYLPKSRITSCSWRNLADEVPNEIRLDNGTQIEFKAYEQGRKAFEGRAIDAFYGDEQCEHKSLIIWREIQARLIDRHGFSAQSMTPVVYQKWFEDRIMSELPTDEVFYADLNDNRISTGGHVPDARIDELIDEWPEEVQETRIKGHLAAFLGSVYKTFNRRKHVIEGFEIPKHWRKIRAIDFGFTNPFVCLWLAIDHDGCFYVYREYYRAQEGMEEHATYIKRHTDDMKAPIQFTFSDHDAQDNFELAKYGVKTTNATKSVHAGIETVQKYLKIRKNGQPRLYIFDSCVNLIKEFPGYHYHEGSDSRDPKDMPVAKDDHALDALRYAMHSYLEPSAKKVKPVTLGKLY